MLRLASDENFHADIVRGLVRRRPDLDLERIHDAGLLAATDDAILEWAARENRIVLTHDRATMAAFAFERVRAGRPMPGVFVVSDQIGIGQAIEEILLLAECTEQQGCVCADLIKGQFLDVLDFASRTRLRAAPSTGAVHPFQPVHV